MSLPRWTASLALIAIIAFGAWVRTHLALDSPAFDREDASGMVQADPGLLYYLTERVIAAGGGVPDDWRADPRIESPAEIDIPATFTVGQEFLVAWARRLFGSSEPLHVFCTRVMAPIASLVFAGVYLLGRELGRSRAVGLLAAALAALLPANYRTIGFVLMREDLSLPLFALHLGLLARAVRVRSRAALIACGLALGAAMATWHALGFVAALEALCLLILFAWRGENPLAVRRAWIVPAALAMCAMLVPALAAKRAVLSFPLLVAAALLGAAWLPADLVARRRFVRRGVALALLAILVVAQRLAATGDLTHVADVLMAKLYYLGDSPSDPSALSFETRMMWQGPFATLAPRELLRVFHVALVLGALFVIQRLRAARGTGNDAAQLMLAIAVPLSIASAWFVERTMVVGGLVLPVAGALAITSLGQRFARAHGPGAGPEAGSGPGVGLLQGAPLLVAGVLALHAWFFSAWFASHELTWNHPWRQAELGGLVRAVPDHVPEDEAICADFMSSTAILAHTGRKIVLQPKWERASTRARVEAFWTAFYTGTPDELRRLVIERFDCHYLLVDRSMFILRDAARFLGGLPRDVPLDPRSAAARLTSTVDADLTAIPGYELIWRSPSELRFQGQSTDFFRLFRLADSIPPISPR